MKAVQNKLLVCITDGNKRVKPGRDRTNYALWLCNRNTKRSEQLYLQ